MYDTNKVFVGVLVFLGLMTSPFWLNAGKFKPMEKLELPKVEKKCVEKTDFMKANHMKLLDDWRYEVVRLDQWEYTSKAFGKTYRKSLVGTCMDCHKTKKKFCDRCHTYAGVKPYCWSCHVAPKEPEETS
ncbi:MAG: sulfate reduction electron transfer complex DsrMKJOP subunit DsrJ [Nitrospirota bacterium]|jgi:hypothetical protein